jgi:N-acyl-D-amino-acid deacylase
MFLLRMRLATATIAFLLTSITQAQTSADVLIKNGRIIDGTGNSWFWGDVAVTGNKISYIGKASSINAKKTIDALLMCIRILKVTK